MADVQSPDDRRRLQNRLNQRARRLRLAESQPPHGTVRRWIIYKDVNKDANNEQQTQSRVTIVPRESQNATSRLCELHPTERLALLQRLKDTVMHSMLQRVLDSELLTSVTQYNIVRAMAVNASHLGLTMEILREDINSPFDMSHPWIIDETILPPSLQPTYLQRRVAHHPWIDISPHASFRNAMLQRAGTYDEQELCHELFMGSGDDNEGQIGLVVWGEAWDPSAYEISAYILRKWPWIAQDCPDIIHSTNQWRSKRQQKPLLLPIESDDTVRTE